MNTTTEHVERAVELYGDTLFRIAMVLLANKHDAEDAVQETFIRMIKADPAFRDEEHEKAWLIKVITNLCRDMQRFRARHPTYELDICSEYTAKPEENSILDELYMLPNKYKVPIYLHYIEGYSIKEISGITHCSQSAVKKQLQRGREVLRIEHEETNH